jgi:nucleoside-diphosphate-sugar epimerase
MTRVLLTGGSGFLGGHLLRTMAARGWDVAVLGRRAVAGTRHFGVEGGVATMTAALKEWRPDVVVHLASLFLSSHGPEDVDRLVESNIVLGARLLESMLQAGATRLVSAGTCWQHFDNAPYSPVNLYAATKQAFEDLCRHYVESHGFAAWHLHLTDTVGTHDPRPKLFRLLDEARRNGSALDMSPGEQRLDLLDAGDAAAGFAHAAAEAITHGTGERVFALRHTEQWTLRAVVECYRRHAGGPSVNFGARPYRPREIMVPSTFPTTLPGWSPRVGLEEAIRSVAMAHRAADAAGASGSLAKQ